MANEFNYLLSLSILHPSMDAKEISVQLHHLRPKIEVTAGDVALDGNGNPFIPQRKIFSTHWSHHFFSDSMIDSGSKPLNQGISDAVASLQNQREFFNSILEEGTIHFFIGIFAKTLCAADIIHASTMMKCAVLGIDLRLDYYGPENLE
jgi:hypothetical protein